MKKNVILAIAIMGCFALASCNTKTQNDDKMLKEEAVKLEQQIDSVKQVIKKSTEEIKNETDEVSDSVDKLLEEL